MSRRRKKTQEEDAGIDLTPMLDVVFIMLIFFIVTTSFVKESGIDVNRPSASSAKKKERASILVAISQNGEIWIQKRRIDIRSVRANIERLHAESPEGTVVIQADKLSQTGILVQVMDQIRLAGVESISVAAAPGAGN
ncbi:MAG: biopolymer transporter ExbD [Bdellovibrionales bacterium]|nr:biopolymer transporter ExbD [Bdellovibrionales bacterium]NQZ19248.1 biopolymer transporter ExbD [Bdellovibrionales bacterium]